MCRIVGFLDLNYKQDYPMDKTILNMRDTLTHGGPDDAGVYLDKDIPLAFGHRRLSILDLSPLGRQPMEFENLVITYNGEVYNFKEIRQELEKEGYRFISNSDTEVILKAFHKWGMQAVQKFRGMFAEVSKYILFMDRGVNHNKLWLLFVFELWRERYC